VRASTKVAWQALNWQKPCSNCLQTNFTDKSGCRPGNSYLFSARVLGPSQKTLGLSRQNGANQSRLGHQTALLVAFWCKRTLRSCGVLRCLVFAANCFN
jgi:hypothetical protein